MLRLVAFLALVALSPVLLVIACAVALEDGFPVLFRQTRMGRGARPFQILKFRSMTNGNSGTPLTARGDARITRVGRFLRRYKLDEIPQLWNLARGEMSLIGPRPEVPAFVNAADPLWRSVLSAKPGITCLATLVFRNEEELLAAAAQPERHYREILLPEKLRLNLEYLQRRDFWSDTKLLLLTLLLSLRPGLYDSHELKRLFIGEACA